MVATGTAGRVRQALREVVAERGFHGASMSAVARAAGVATGTAYVHYGSKDELVLAAYVEAKHDLVAAAVAAHRGARDPEEQFVGLWLGAWDHLVAAPVRARFLLQVDVSPYACDAHDLVTAGAADPLSIELDRLGLRAHFVDLPDPVLYELGVAPAVRLAASGIGLSDAQAEQTARACWSAISR